MDAPTPTSLRTSRRRRRGQPDAAAHRAPPDAQEQAPALVERRAPPFLPSPPREARSTSACQCRPSCCVPELAVARGRRRSRRAADDDELGRRRRPYAAPSLSRPALRAFSHRTRPSRAPGRAPTRSVRDARQQRVGEARAVQPERVEPLGAARGGPRGAGRAASRRRRAGDRRRKVQRQLRNTCSTPFAARVQPADHLLEERADVRARPLSRPSCCSRPKPSF